HVLGLGQWHEGGLGGEQAPGDRGPLGLAGLVVQVDGADRAELIAGRVDHGAALPALDGVDAWWHTASLSRVGVWWLVGWRTGRLAAGVLGGRPVVLVGLAVATQPAGRLGRELLGSGVGVDRRPVP